MLKKSIHKEKTNKNSSKINGVENIENILREMKLKFIREYKFDTGEFNQGKWKGRKRLFRFDFFIPEYKIAIEFEGGVFNFKRGGKLITVGGHNTSKGFFENCIKYNLAAMHGIIVLRYTIKHFQKIAEKYGGGFYNIKSDILSTIISRRKFK